MELIAKEGYNPMEYIRFYNLRNYDRINASAIMRQAEKASGVNYEDARKQHDAAMSASRPSAFDTTAAYPQYQQAAQHVAATNPQAAAVGRWDTVSSCYMLGGEDIRNVPWEHDNDTSEIDAFVTEELYVHSKVFYPPQLLFYPCSGVVLSNNFTSFSSPMIERSSVEART